MYSSSPPKLLRVYMHIPRLPLGSLISSVLLFWRAVAIENYPAWNSIKSLGFTTPLESRVQNSAWTGDDLSIESFHTSSLGYYPSVARFQQGPKLQIFSISTSSAIFSDIQALFCPARPVYP